MDNGELTRVICLVIQKAFDSIDLSIVRKIEFFLTVNKLQSHPTKTKMMVIGLRNISNLKVSDFTL